MTIFVITVSVSTTATSSNEDHIVGTHFVLTMLTTQPGTLAEVRSNWLVLDLGLAAVESVVVTLTVSIST